MVMPWGLYPPHPQMAHPSFWRSELSADFARLRAAHGSVLPFGNGRSYGDSCMAASDHVLAMRGLNRFIAVNWERGVMTAEAGVTLGEILSVAIPNGWFLPVTPGTQHVTLGGAIANDVHGKNHHVRGTFGRHVLGFTLLRSDQAEPVLCTPTHEQTLFAATIGGLGLTGVIGAAEIQLLRIGSSAIEAEYFRFANLDGFFGLSAQWDAQSEYTVAWIDCLARGGDVGRGVFIRGNHAPDGELRVYTGATKTVPFTPPVSLVNTASLRLFNAAYYRAQRVAGRVGYHGFFYPLDAVQHWNRIYGPRGFQQYQCVLPESTAREALKDMLQRIAASGRGSFLAVLKRCGDVPSPGVLSFPMAGFSLALDFAQHEALTRELFPVLDAIVREAGGRLYPAKDAHMAGEDFRRGYPHWEQVERLRDPALCSRFWQRVTR